jgi:ribosome-binding factor A
MFRRRRSDPGGVMFGVEPMANPTSKTPKRATASAPSQRMLRVGEQVRHALVQVLQRREIDDPQIGAALISVTEVRMSPDLKVANAFVSAMGGENTDLIVKALGRHAKFLRGRLSSDLRQMRSMPELRFRADTSFENFAKIDRLLHSEVVRRDVESGGGDD